MIKIWNRSWNLYKIVINFDKKSMEFVVKWLKFETEVGIYTK